MYKKAYIKQRSGINSYLIKELNTVNNNID